MLAPEQTIMLGTGPAARRLCRDTLAFCLTMRHYVGNLRTLGFTDREVSDGRQ